MKSIRAVILVSLIWAFALIASSYFLKGLAIGDWVDAILYLGVGVWFGTWILRPACYRPV